MPSGLLSQFIAFPASLLLGGWLALISYSNPAQAKTTSGNFLMAQAVVEPLSPPPPTQGVFYSQLPQLQPSSPVPVIEFRQQPQPDKVKPVEQYHQTYRRSYRRQYSRQYRRQYSRQYSQNYNQKFGRYLVYVNDDSAQRLQQVRLVEPKAYIQEYQGHSVIQAGAFSREYNAQQRVGQLRSYGINRTQIISFSNGEGRPYSYSGEGRPYSYSGDYSYSGEGRPYSYSGYDDGRNSSKSYYYVTIPAKSEELPLIESRIKQSLGLNTGVISRDHPLGSHVAVGPFTQQSDAEQWNNFLRHQGFSNARVYYGR